ncbi:MAG: cation transporter [Bacteroidetes bacterium HGW-Bacteroidetes-21]|jgi:cation diffusion facilitator family transporter|nr:MAG: cation transporter [Bacteroidetes bacterium HGW-Bacteroidetes-21]
MSQKSKAAVISIYSNTSLIIIKVVAGILSGSVSIISEALHSASDLLASFIAYFSIKIAEKPADKDHPFGHGKFENVSGVIEALLIFVAAGWIIYESVHAIINPKELEQMGLAIVIMLISSVVNFFVSRYLYKVAKQTRSVALEADALHLKTDVLTAAGIGIGLIIIWLTGYTFLDPIIAILVALYILYESYLLLKKAFQPLTDIALPKEEIALIEEIINSHNLMFHGLRTRQAGQFRFVEFHLEMNKDATLMEVHDICNLIENEIEVRLENTEVTIHAEPREDESDK